MPAARPPADVPRLSWGVLVGVPVGAALVSGLAVYAGLFLASGDGVWRWGGVAQSTLRAAIYVGVMWPGLLLTSRATVAHWPLRGPGDIARHVAAIVAMSALLFVLGTVAVRLLLGDVIPVRVIALIAIVAAATTAGLSTVLYGALAWQRLRRAEAAALQAELRALRAQINPHFLFNSLNTIAALARVRPDEAERVTEHLADLFRYSLAASEAPSVSLGDEVASAETYLAIERARFGAALAVEVDVPDALRARPVPSLVLQPLVENAVQHGVRRAEGHGTVTVRARDDGGALVVEVLDTGPGFGTDSIADVLGRGTGLTNVHERLRATHGPGAGLRLVPGGVALHIPAHHA